MDPIGAHHYWGFSPAEDYQQLYRTVMGASPTTAADSERSPLNILLLQPGDPRSILKTIAQRSRHADRPLHFFLFEKPCEALARDLLLLAIAVDWELPLRQRAATWLEVFGNALVQSRTSKYISSERLALIDLLCNQRGPVPLGTVVDQESLLKYKERDEMEFIYKTWDEGSGAFDMAQLRDYRLRHNYGDRYDYRTNLVDWDYQAVLKKESGIVHWVQYRDWRNSGVAFEYGDVKYDLPNRTLASYVEGKERGRGSVARRGYWGDTVVSPFHAVGTAAYIPTDDEAKGTVAAEEVQGVASSSSGSAAVGNYGYQLFDITSRHTGSEQHRHHAVEVATYNLLSWLFEIQTGRQYVMKLQHDIYSGLADAAQVSRAGAAAGEGTETEGEGGQDGQESAAGSKAAREGKLSEAEHASIQAAARAAAVARAKSIARAFKDVTITVLTGDLKEHIERGRLTRWGGMHVVAASGRTVHHLADPAFRSILHPSGAVLVTETARNVVNLKAEQRDEFVRRVLAMGGRLGATLVGSDRQLSADTFASGTVIDLNKKDDGGRGKDWKREDSDVPGLPPSACPFAFITSKEGPLPGIGLQPDAVPSTALPSSIVSSLPALATLGEKGEADGAGKGLPVRAKRLGMAAYTHKGRPMPVVQALRQASSGGGGTGEDASVARSKLALHIVKSLRAHISGVSAHEVAGGDNPRPEALVFAYIPGPVAEEVASAFGDVQPMAKGDAGLGKSASSGTGPSAATAAGAGPMLGGPEQLSDEQVTQARQG